MSRGYAWLNTEEAFPIRWMESSLAQCSLGSSREVSVKPSQHIEPLIELFTGVESHGTRGRDVK